MPFTLDQLTLQRMLEIIVIANTPAFIVDTVSDEGFLDAAVSRCTTDEILAAVRERAALPRASVTEEDAVTIIALTATLCDREPRKVASLRDLRIPWLMWWEQIRDSVIARTRSYNLEVVEARSQPISRTWEAEDEPPEESGEITVLRAGA